MAISANYNNREGPTMSRPRPKFTTPYDFLNIYTPQQTLNDSKFHFFSEPQPGYQQVSLHCPASAKPITMYYEILDSQRREPIRRDDTTPLYTCVEAEPEREAISVDRDGLLRDSEWVKKYSPASFAELLTDEAVNFNLMTWLKSWDPIVFKRKLPAKKATTTASLFNRNMVPQARSQPQQPTAAELIFNNPKKLLLLAGPPGCGKTTIVRVLAKICKYDVVEINASDDRSANNLISKIESTTSNDTIKEGGKPVLICLDEVDGMAENEANGISKLLNYIEKGSKGKEKAEETDLPQGQAKDQKENKKTGKFNYNNYKFDKGFKAQSHNSALNRPIIFICNDPYAKSIRQLRQKAHVMYFNEISSDRILKRMKEILEKQKVHIEMQVLESIAQICKNDIRSCIGIMELLARDKKSGKRQPKQILSKLKFSFARDSQATASEFVGKLLSKRTNNWQELTKQKKEGMNLLRVISSEVQEVDNPPLLLETYMQNLLKVPGLMRKSGTLLELYQQVVKEDLLIRNGFKYNNQLQMCHAFPYIGFMLTSLSDQGRKIEYPSLFFEKNKKKKQNEQILGQIYKNIPLHVRIYHLKQSLISSYLLALYLAMQTSSTREEQIVKCVLTIISYNFKLKKQYDSEEDVKFPIFLPEIDKLLAFGSRKPEILMTNTTKTLIQQNYEFFEERKTLLSSNEMKENPSVLITKLSLNSRKKVSMAGHGLKYRFAEGTGTKTSYNLKISYFDR